MKIRLRKSCLAVLFCLTVIFAVFRGTTAEAATPKVSGTYFSSWGSSARTSAYIGIKDFNATQFQYMVFKLNGTRIRTTTLQRNQMYTKSNNKKYIYAKVEGLSTTEVRGIKIRAYRNGAWGAWSNNYYIVPAVTLKMSNNADARTVTLRWNKITGVGDYLVQVSTDAKTWKTSRSTKKTVATCATYSGKKFVLNKNYYFRVVSRRRIKGVSYLGRPTTYGRVYFYRTYTYN